MLFFYIRLSEKFLSFYEEIIDTQPFLFYIILSKDPFCSVETDTATFHKLGLYKYTLL